MCIRDSFYAVGGNEKATKLSGINTNRVYFLAYLNMGLLAAIAGMVTVARLNSANPTAGNSYEMDAIGACFIGGASAYGGTGTVPGVIVGATLMGVLNLGMSIMGVDQNLSLIHIYGSGSYRKPCAPPGRWMRMRP